VEVEDRREHPQHGDDGDARADAERGGASAPQLAAEGHQLVQRDEHHGAGREGEERGVQTR
jgi:hypothetical protein